MTRSAAHARPRVTVIATGGTIASTQTTDGAAPELSGDDLLAAADGIAELRALDLMAKDSSSLTLADMQAISDAVKAQLDDDAADAVVVLHGTDAMEETALLVALQNAPRKPIVFTGAQFTADHPLSDGPANLRRAVELTLAERVAPRGVLVALGGRVLPVWGLYKFSSDSPDAFRRARDIAMPAIAPLPGRVDALRVDLVAIYPGCDATHIHASLAVGAQGVVLAALGSGNATRAVVEAVRECAARGVTVATSSRAPDGLLAPIYGGGGGGHDLARAGAIHAATLRPGQARILLAQLLAAGAPREAIAAAFADR